MDEIFPSFVPLSKLIVAGKLTDAPLIQTPRDAYSISPNAPQTPKASQAFFWKPVAPKPSQFYPRAIEPDARSEPKPHQYLLQSARAFAPAPHTPLATPDRATNGYVSGRQECVNRANGITSYFGRTSELTGISPLTSPSVERSPSPEYVRPPPSKYQRRLEMIERDDRRDEQARNKRRAQEIREEQLRRTPSDDEDFPPARKWRARRPCKFIDDEAEADEVPVRKRQRPAKPVQVAQQKKREKKVRKIAVSSDSEEENPFARYLQTRTNGAVQKNGKIESFYK